MKANYKDKIKPSSEVTLGNLYEMNKQLMEQEPVITKEELQVAKEQLRAWVSKNSSQKYFMMLCHEQRDYTLFNLDKTSSWGVIPATTIFTSVEDIIECLQNRGELLVADLQESQAWEFWIRNENGCFAYYLFPYGTAVLEY